MFLVQAEKKQNQIYANRIKELEEKLKKQQQQFVAAKSANSSRSLVIGSPAVTKSPKLMDTPKQRRNAESLDAGDIIDELLLDSSFNE